MFSRQILAFFWMPAHSTEQKRISTSQCMPPGIFHYEKTTVLKEMNPGLLGGEKGGDLRGTMELCSIVCRRKLPLCDLLNKQKTLLT